jgi:putative membrane protein
MSLDLTLDWSTITSIALPALIGVAYFVRVGNLREQGRQPSALRQASFACGMALIVIATVGPLDSLADDFAFGHMVQHTILLDESALLLALGLTGPVLAPILTKPGIRRLQILMHPVVAVVVWLVVMYGWHAPPLYQAAEEHDLIHLCEHACFVAAGVGMWLALLGPFPKPEWFGNGARAVYAGAIHFSSMGLANILMWSGTVLYPIYVASDRAHGIAPITDQSTAGVVLMVQSVVMMLGVLAWLVLRWAREDTERQELLDLAQERGIALDARRASRAVSAGRGAELRSRLLSGGEGLERLGPSQAR